MRLSKYEGEVVFGRALRLRRQLRLLLASCRGNVELKVRQVGEESLFMKWASPRMVMHL